MVGLFKKLSKKKPRKKNVSASEDESCTEDEGPEKLLHYNRFNSPTSASADSSNGICSVTPDACSQSIPRDPCNFVDTSARNSAEINFEGIEDNMKDSLDFANNDEDDILSVTSADEGSLFDEDILSQFQDGQISLQQFLQSPHLSRSEERIRDEEIDSFFSDSRSIESSNYYSDSSSGSNRTEQRDEELDRIAGELFGDYGDRFSNKDDCFAIQKAYSNGNVNEFDNRSLGNCSIGEQTVTNSYSTLTITAEDNDPYSDNFFGGEIKTALSSGFANKEIKALPTPRLQSSSPGEVVSSPEISRPTSSAAHSEGGSSATAQLEVQPKSPVESTSVSATELIKRPVQDDGYEESQKTLLDIVHERGKATLLGSSKGSDAFNDQPVSSPTPPRSISPFEKANAINSRPSSAQSQLSQREVSIIENTFVSSEGQYTLASNNNEAREVKSRVDPWLSYLPNVKTNAPKGSSLPRPVGRDGNEKTGEYVNISNVTPVKVMLRPGSALPMTSAMSPSNLSDQDRYIRFSSLDLDFFIPPPPCEDDTISCAQQAEVDATPFNLEWEYEICGSPTLTPSSSVIYIGNRDSSIDNADPIAESLLSLLPIDRDNFEESVSNALGEIITEIVSSRQKIYKLTKIIEFQDIHLKEQRKLIDSQAKDLSQFSRNSHMGEALRLQRSPQVARRSEFKSYPATGRRSKELADLEDTLDKLLYQCHTLQKSSNSRPDIQVFQPITREGGLSRAESSHSDDSVVEVKALLCKKVPDSPANHVQIVPAKGVVYNSCKEMKDDMNAINK